MYRTLIFLGLCVFRLHARFIFKSEGVGTSASGGHIGTSRHGKPLLDDVEEFGWLGVGKPIAYIKSHDSLATPTRIEELDDHVPKITQEQNIARWALRQAIEQPAASLTPVDKSSSEVFTALIWLIGIAEGRSEEWTSEAWRWTKYEGKLPDGRSRVARFHKDFEKDYNWLRNSRAEGLATEDDSDVAARAIYLGHVLFAKRQAISSHTLYYKPGTNPTKRSGSVLSSFNDLIHKSHHS